MGCCDVQIQQKIIRANKAIKLNAVDFGIAAIQARGQSVYNDLYLANNGK